MAGRGALTYVSSIQARSGVISDCSLPLSGVSMYVPDRNHTAVATRPGNSSCSLCPPLHPPTPLPPLECYLNKRTHHIIRTRLDTSWPRLRRLGLTLTSSLRSPLFSDMQRLSSVVESRGVRASIERGPFLLLLPTISAEVPGLSATVHALNLQVITY